MMPYSSAVTAVRSANTARRPRSSLMVCTLPENRHLDWPNDLYHNLNNSATHY
jgi:hypothetical protein